MSLIFFDDPKVGPRWNGLAKFMQEVEPKKRRVLMDKFAMAYPTWFLEWLTEVDGERLVLDEFQLLFALDDHKNKAVNKTRQAGMSLVVSGVKLWKALSRYGYRCDVVSVNRSEAQDKIRYAKAFYSTLPMRWQSKFPLTSDNLERIGFNSGSKESFIKSVAASAGVRGGKKDIVFDEAHFVPNLDVLYTAALPATVRSTQKTSLGFTMISTPNGQQGKYYEIVSNENGKFNDWSRLEFGWWEVGLFCKDKEAAKKRWEVDYQKDNASLFELYDEFATDALKEVVDSLTDEEYLQEFCCVFLDESTAFFTYELIDRCKRFTEWQAEGQKENKEWFQPWESRPDGNEQEVNIGIDFAEGKKGGDSTSIQVFEHGTDSVWRQRYYQDLNYRDGYDDFDKQIGRIVEIVDAFKPTNVFVDGTGAGIHVSTDLGKQIGNRTNFEEVRFTNQNKGEMVLNLKHMMEREALHWQEPYRAFRAQFHHMKRTITSAGNVLYEGKPHDDIFFATALAVKGSMRGGFQIITI